MFAAAGEEEVFVVFIALSACLVALWMILGHRSRQQRLETIQKALDAQSIDGATRQALLDVLTSDARRTNQIWQSVLQQFGRWVRTLVFVGGWISFVIGGVMLLVSMLNGHWNHYSMEPAIVATAVGFALVTLPVAMAELERSRTARVQR